MDEYRVRQFRKEDRDDFLDLYSLVMGGSHSVDWFHWKYRDNPFINHIPIVIAKSDEELVGARAFFALRLKIDQETHLVLQPCDTMVHPSHRRQGLFTRMTERALDLYTDSNVSFFYNFPGKLSRPGYLKLGWEEIGPVPTHNRIQRPEVMASQSDAMWAPVAGYVSKPVFRGYNMFRDRQRVPSEMYDIKKSDSIPVSEFAMLKSRIDFERIHAERNERFVEYRFANPDWKYRTYLARLNDQTLGMMIVSSTQTQPRRTRILDWAISPSENLKNIFQILMDAIIHDFNESVYITILGRISKNVLSESGFFSDNKFPLHYIKNVEKPVVRTLTGSWKFNGMDIRDLDNWNFSFSEVDTS